MLYRSVPDVCCFGLPFQAGTPMTAGRPPDPGTPAMPPELTWADICYVVAIVAILLGLSILAVLIIYVLVAMAVP